MRQEMHLLKRNWKSFMKEYKDHEVNIVMGDFNAKVGRGRHTDIVGREGLGEMKWKRKKVNGMVRTKLPNHYEHMVQ